MTRLPGLLALLFALLLPLQGFALSLACDGAPAATAHCAQHEHGAPAAGHHHDCGACCLAVTPATPSHLPGIAPPAAEPVAYPVTGHPALLDHRLDRPPRRLPG